MDAKVPLSLGLLLLMFIIDVYGDDPDRVYRPHKRMPKPSDDGEWKKKDVRDYSDIDVEKLYEQWEEEEEEIPVDELPPWELEPPPIDMRKVNIKDKDSILREGKRYRTLMMFATVAGPIDRKRTEQISARWETSLFNANLQMKRYVIDDDRILIQLDDGSNAIRIRDFLLEQEECLEVTVDNKTYDGKGKKITDKFKPMTKEEAKKKKEEEQEAKAAREKIKEENRKKEAAKKNKEKNKKKNTKKAKKDEL